MVRIKLNIFILFYEHQIMSLLTDFKLNSEIFQSNAAEILMFHHIFQDIFIKNKNPYTKSENNTSCC